MGEKTAETVKKTIGCVYPLAEAVIMEIKGRSLQTGLPAKVMISSSEMLEALGECAMEIVNGVNSILEQTPPEIVGDIIANGILLTGGGSNLKGLDILIEKCTGINVYVAENPESCVAIGTGRALENISLISEHSI